jgi:hypothetical protein
MKDRVFWIVFVIVIVSFFGFMFSKYDPKKEEAKKIAASESTMEENPLAGVRSLSMDRVRGTGLPPKAKKLTDKYPAWPEEICEVVAEKRIRIGMTKEQVRVSWGKPERVNRTVTSRSNHEQWVYGGAYLYFDDDILTSFQD